MNTTEINKLYGLINAGESAQDQLNQYVEEIYDFYVEEITRQRELLEKEYPEFDGLISDLENMNGGFHKFEISGERLLLTGYDYFRGETDYETDYLPASIFGADDWKEQIISFVESKISPRKQQIEKHRVTVEQNERQQFEVLKQKYEGTK